MNPSEVLSIFLFVQMLGLGLGQVACGTSVDVAFLVSRDSSRSPREYAQQKDFVIDAAQSLGIGRGDSQAAIVLFSDSASLQARIRPYATVDEFARAVHSLPPQRGTLQRFDTALRLSVIELHDRGRKGVPKVVLLISTDYLRSDVYDLIDVSQRLKDNGVYILAVGIGQTDLMNQLLLVTDADDVFMMNNFQELLQNLGKITRRACDLIEKCRSSPCQNGATCVNDAGTYNCVCKRGYNGNNCETNVDDCASVTCKNGGTCVDLVADYRCDCPIGYYGKKCEKGGGCPRLIAGSKAFDKDIEFDNMTWFETPSVVHDGADGYQVLGRKVHMDYIREHLKNRKNVNLDEIQESSNNIQLTILADTVYVKGKIKMRGMKKLAIFSRKIAFVKESQLDLSAPTLTQSFSGNLPAGAHGSDGKHGANGPTVELYADLLEGYVNILLSGGSGLQGQNGANGKIGIDRSDDTRPDRAQSECSKGKTKWGCTANIPGRRGKQGGAGGNGGNAGRSGNGGNAGSLTLHVRTVEGKAEIKSCPGKGGTAAVNGKGGAGGKGGSGGRGLKCKPNNDCKEGLISSNCWDRCEFDGFTGPAAGGEKGRNGKDGRVGIPGSDGSVVALINSSLGRREMEKYPLALLNLMTRYVEDLIWANKINSSEAVLKFIVQLTKGRTDASHLRKVAKRRLAFLNKEGFDRFGNNELFAPLMKWETMKKGMETIKDRAKSFEDAYNSLETSIQEEISELKKVFPLATLIQVRREKERLVESRRIAISEKGAYVAAIGELEASMNNSLESIGVLVTGVYEKAKFKRGDLLVILQGITGFYKGVFGNDPLSVIETSLGVLGHFTLKCKLGTLQSIKDKIKKWMTFGKAYNALKDSNDLDFDQMDVTAVPEMMKANLEMNKEGMAAGLVCMLEERSLPRDKAKFQEQIERFFIAGAARIDLIAKVIDLDNDIGGYNFDIRNLNDTANDIQKLVDSADADSPIEDSVKQMFRDDLLTSYKEIETRFAKHLYQFYKSYEFRSLWDLNDRITEFQRRASEAAKGTGKLHGVMELTEAMNEIDKIELKGQKCFTSLPYKIDTHKWSFDNVKDKVMFSEIHQGKTKFALNISDSCEHCYNARLLKMYVELYGDNMQSGNYPAKVYLKLRHMSGSHFRDGNRNIREFRQKLGFFRTFEFNRFAITNTTKCNEETEKDNRDSLYCMPKTDRRLQSMCCHFLSDFQCDDTLLGAVECRSPFGTYELTIPIDDKLPCTASSTEITDQNCKDFDRSQFTKMNVWISFIHWTGNYPTGPDDVKCSTALAKSEKAPPNASVQP